jgi:hypothetical protein
MILSSDALVTIVATLLNNELEEKRKTNLEDKPALAWAVLNSIDQV